MTIPDREALNHEATAMLEAFGVLHGALLCLAAWTGDLQGARAYAEKVSGDIGDNIVQGWRKDAEKDRALLTAQPATASEDVVGEAAKIIQRGTEPGLHPKEAATQIAIMLDEASLLRQPEAAPGETVECKKCRGWGALGMGGRDGTCPDCGGDGKVSVAAPSVDSGVSGKQEVIEALTQCIDRMERCENYKYGIDGQKLLPQLHAAIEFAKKVVADLKSPPANGDGVK